MLDDGWEIRSRERTKKDGATPCGLHALVVVGLLVATIYELRALAHM
jgi:hypothetical protein